MAQEKIKGNVKKIGNLRSRPNEVPAPRETKNTPKRKPVARTGPGTGLYFAQLVEAAGGEPASAQASQRHLRAYSAITFRHAACPRTGQRHRNQPVDSRSRARLPGTGRQPAHDARSAPQAQAVERRGTKPRRPIRRWLLCFFPDVLRGQPGSSARNRSFNWHVETGRPLETESTPCGRLLQTVQ